MLSVSASLQWNTLWGTSTLDPLRSQMSPTLWLSCLLMDIRQTTTTASPRGWYPNSPGWAESQRTIQTTGREKLCSGDIRSSVQDCTLSFIRSASISLEVRSLNVHFLLLKEVLALVRNIRVNSCREWWFLVHLFLFYFVEFIQMFHFPLCLSVCFSALSASHLCSVSQSFMYLNCVFPSLFLS